MFFRFYVFLVGCTITGVEMAASRFLAPYFGTSLIVWANVIGIILLALAVGYSLGGKISDRHPHERGFYTVGTIGSGILLFIPFVIHGILASFSGNIFSQPLELLLGSFFSSLLLFGLPVLFLAMLSPYAVRVSGVSVEQMGRTAGNLYFWSTLGSIIGIYLTSFVLVPFLGLRETIWLYGLLLFVPSVLCLPRRILTISSVALLFLLTYLFYPRTSAQTGVRILYHAESLYQHIEVGELLDGTRLLFFNDGQGTQSVYNPTESFTGLYYDYFAALPFLKQFSEKKELHTLILGYAGGTIGKLLFHSHPASIQVQTDGVEIDPVVTDISKQFMGVTEDERKLATMDGRAFLQQTDTRYDVIVIDAYSQEIYIPAHMITREFFSEVAAHLSDGGIVVFNLNAARIDSPLLQAAMRTVASAGLQVAVLPIKGSYNFLVVASRHPFDPAFAASTDEQLTALEHTWTDSLQTFPPTGDAVIFTDNRSPVDMMIHQEILGEVLRR